MYSRETRTQGAIGTNYNLIAIYNNVLFAMICDTS